MNKLISILLVILLTPNNIIADPLSISKFTKNPLKKMNNLFLCKGINDELFTNEQNICIDPLNVNISARTPCLEWSYEKVNKDNFIAILKEREFDVERCKLLEKEYTKKEFQLDCNDNSREAVTDLPYPLNQWGKLVCTLYGQMIVPAGGWSWIAPGIDSVTIWSQFSSDIPKLIGNKGYFVDITVKELIGDEAENAYLYDEQFELPGKDKTKIYKLTARNQKSEIFRSYILDGGFDNIWGYKCNPECKPNSAFHIINHQCPKSETAGLTENVIPIYDYEKLVLYQKIWCDKYKHAAGLIYGLDVVGDNKDEHCLLVKIRVFDGFGECALFYYIDNKWEYIGYLDISTLGVHSQKSWNKNGFEIYTYVPELISDGAKGKNIKLWRYTYKLDGSTYYLAEAEYGVELGH